MERRKGIWLFCEALDRLKYELGGRKVTFLGKFTHEDGESTGYTLLRRSAEWPFAPTILYNYDREQALAYLKGGNRLAVMPSREDNSPCVILECLIEGIPFIASSGSGGQELIRESDHQHCLFEPTADGLTAKLRSVLAKGAVTGQPSFAPLENARTTMNWVSALVAEVRSERAAAPDKGQDKRAQGNDPQRTLLLLAPEDLTTEQISDRAREAASRHPDCNVIVFADDAAPFEEKRRRATPGLPQNLRFCGLAAFAEETAKMRREGNTLLLCRLDQPIPAALVDRAESAFRSTKVDALTAMRGHALETVRPEQPFVCAGSFHWVPDEYKTGNCRALMEIAQDSNAGLLALRSDIADVLARVSPRDPQLCRLKDIDLYIHEVLLELAAEGRTFELLPDCFLPAAAMAASRETFELPRIVMRHLLKTRSMPAGSEAALLSRLSIEVFASDAARENALDLLSGLTSRMGEAILQPDRYWPPEQAFATYARIAHASGRPQLALSLIANALAADTPFERDKNPTPSSLVSRQAQTLDLTRLALDGRHSGMNLNHPWSLRHNHQEIEIHPNGSHEGDAVLIFAGLSFEVPTIFSSEIELTASARGPVRFEIELQAPSVESQGHSWDLQPGERKIVEFVIPAVFQAGCDALLATRMVRRRDSTEGAHAKWHRPAFRPR